MLKNYLKTAWRSLLKNRLSSFINIGGLSIGMAVAMLIACWIYNEWTFDRALLEQGLRSPAGSGEVRVWPCGRVQAVVEFHSEQGVSVVQFETKTIMRFLRRTYTATTPVAS